MLRLRSRVTYANVMSTFAAVVALGAGSAYAVTQLPVHSVGTKQLANSAVTGHKVKNGSLKAKDFKTGQLPAGAQGPTGPKGDKGVPGDDGAPAGAYLGTVSNINIPATTAHTCFVGHLTEPGVHPGDTVLVVPDYAGTFPVQVSVGPAIVKIANDVPAQFCNTSGTSIISQISNQTVAFWRVAGPTP